MTEGMTLGRYEIPEPCGAGGMVEVYKARDTRLDRIVAIKISFEQFSARFEREAQRAAVPFRQADPGMTDLLSSAPELA